MEEHLMFVYRGVVTNENSIPLLMLLEKEMENSEFGFVGRKRLFMFVLESLQNITRHRSDMSHAKMSLVIYSKAGDGYTVTTGNAIRNDNVLYLENKLKEINNLKPEDVRLVYRQMLGNTELSIKGGAGLGLIEMAKKTGNRLDYDFVKLDETFSYFVLSKTVDEGGTGEHKSGIREKFKGDRVVDIEREMALNNIYLIWSGDISPSIGKEMLSFAELKMNEEDIDATIRKKVFNILVEILQNVTVYNPGTEISEKLGLPIALLTMENNVFSLSSGSLIKNSDVPHLVNNINTVNSIPRPELREYYRKLLKERVDGTGSSPLMVLVDMARKSGSNLSYHMESITDAYSYYTITVKVGSNNS